MLFIYYNY